MESIVEWVAGENAQTYNKPKHKTFLFRKVNLGKHLKHGGVGVVGAILEDGQGRRP